MDYKQKMTRHLQAAEKANADVDKFEAYADAKVELAGDLDHFGKARESVKLERMSAKLNGEPLYRQRSGVRDYHVRMATMYGIAYLVQEVYDNDPAAGR